VLFTGKAELSIDAKQRLAIPAKTRSMLEQARAAGATEVWNVRYETSNIRSAGFVGTSR